MYVATTKDEGNAADGRFSIACCGLTPLTLYAICQKGATFVASSTLFS